MTRVRLLDRVDPAPVLAEQRHRRVNFDRDEVDAGWHHDLQRAPLGTEESGPPQAGGVWETACRLVAAYEMADPGRIRAVYEADSALEGRDLLLEGRFLVLRFYMGVRITEVIDEQRGAERIWGWAYETLEGHLERGRMSYEVVKHEDTGAVELVITAYSQGTPTLGPVTALGWRLFGRRTQLSFYRSCGTRLRRLTQQRLGSPHPVPERRIVDGLVLAPTDATSGGLRLATIRRHQPG